MEKVFSCQLSGMSREIDFKCLTLEDEIWIQDTFPKYKEQMTTESLDMGVLSAILYRCILNKELFSADKVEEFDESGQLTERIVGGLELFRKSVHTQADQIALISAFVEVCNKSRPQATEIVKKKSMFKRLILWPLLTGFALVIIGLIARSWV